MSYKDLSSIQKEKYKSISGYEYIENSLNGKVMTNNAYNEKKWEKYSPWIFEYQFHQDTGFFFCCLFHRMTNNRPFGWDYHGNELDYKLITKIYEPDGLFSCLKICDSA